MSLRLKHLIMKFSYDQLAKLCQEKDWSIPTLEQLRQHRGAMEYKKVWIRNEPDHDNEDGTRKVLYWRNSDDTSQINKSFMEHCIVIKNKGK